MASIARTFASAKPALGVLRMDYDCPTNEGGIDCVALFGYEVQHKICKGLTFEMCKGGLPALIKE
eukprot:7668206-Prorocentrum_lima.AAC.1